MRVDIFYISSSKEISKDDGFSRTERVRSTRDAPRLQDRVAEACLARQSKIRFNSYGVNKYATLRWHLELPWYVKGTRVSSYLDIAAA